ncbi:hypothetical protein HPP92_013686 [Vanilla planifolia]|uniref:HTH myb-type domain-containing protein n=2 Tax=Vanilla planifolia TaxID=51239 RepID=A0A835R2F6_VANPL|nr:hypothetical protein HPP92_013686 [Vanilla planifolia]
MGPHGRTIARRTDNEIKNYWNTRIKRRQRAGLPLYPPEIQRQLALRNQKQGIPTSPLPASFLDSNSSSPTTAALPLLTQNTFSSFVDDPTLHKNFRVNNTLSFQFPLASVSPTASTLFPNAASAHYLFGNCDLTPPTPSLNSRAYSEKAELPSTQPFAGSDRGKRLKLTPSTRQGNAGLLESLLQESQGDEELFKEGLCFEPLPPSCSKHCLVMNSLCKMGDSLCSNEILQKEAAAEQSLAVPRVINHDISIHLDTIPARTTEAPTAAVTHDWCDGGDSGGDISNRPSPVVGNADLGSEMHQLSSTLSMAHDWAFGSCAWDNLPGIC